MIGNIGDLPYLVLIAVIVLIAGSQLPKIARNVGVAGKEFRKAQQEAEEDAEKERQSKAAKEAQAAQAAQSARRKLRRRSARLLPSRWARRPRPLPCPSRRRWPPDRPVTPQKAP